MGLLEKQEAEFISGIKKRIRAAQYEAMKVVNTQLIQLYWEIGKSISEKQKAGWGKGIVPKLSLELQKDFPGTGGFSVSNLWYMAQFYSEYQGDVNLEPMVREISWSKQVIIMKKCKDPQARRFYIQCTRKYNRTKEVLIDKIRNNEFELFLINQTNFATVMPDDGAQQSVLAIKDHYTFDFLNLPNQHQERQLEEKLVQNIRSFLLEMGSDYTFIGNQYKIEVADQEYFIDLLLYHRKLQSIIAIELKIGTFIPEYKGKMEFYLAVLNDKVKLPHENDSIGIIICKSKNRTVVEYSLKTGTLPIGVATYGTTSSLPQQYRDLLPDSKQIENKLSLFFADGVSRNQTQ